MTRLKQVCDGGSSSSEARRTANVQVHPWSVRPVTPVAVRVKTMSPICGTRIGGVVPMTATFRMVSRTGWS